MQGLRQILQLRGGDGSIESKTWIRVSLFWIEHNISADQDTIPFYPPPHHFLKNQYSISYASQGLMHRHEAISSAQTQSYLSGEMLEILTEVSVLTVTLNSESARWNIWQDSDFPGFEIYPTMFKLLSIQATPQDGQLQYVAQELCRLGALLFFAEIRRKFGVSPVVTTTQIIKLRMLFELDDIIWDDTLERLRLWALVMAGCATTIEDERIWIVQTLARNKIPETYKGQHHLHEVISNMWWIEQVFSAKYELLEVELQRSYGRENSRISVQARP